MKRKASFFSLIDPAPPGFEARKLQRADVLRGAVAIYATDLQQAFDVIPIFASESMDRGDTGYGAGFQ